MMHSTGCHKSCIIPPMPYWKAHSCVARARAHTGAGAGRAVDASAKICGVPGEGLLVLVEPVLLGVLVGVAVLAQVVLVLGVRVLLVV